MTKLEKHMFACAKGYSPSQEIYRVEVKQNERSASSNPYSEICEAIILQAVTDYRKALKKLHKKPNKWLGETIEEVEEFFQSKWFQDISPIDGVWLMERIKSETQMSAVAA